MAQAGGIFGQRYAIDGAKLGNEFSVNTTTEGYQEQTLITALKRGGFVVTWISYGDEGSVDADIYGQRYAQDGARSGEEFKVNTSATIWQRLRKEPRHSLSGLQDGGFVATWARPEAGWFGYRRFWSALYRSWIALGHRVPNQYL